MCYGNVGARVGRPVRARREDRTRPCAAAQTASAAGGTSAAAAIVAGVAALVKAQDPEASPATIKFALMNSVGIRDPGLIPISVSGGRRQRRPRPRAAQRPRARTAPAGPWKTCDPDHDGLTSGGDECPAQFGPGQHRGCPDTDGDGRRDIDDNCATRPNADQADDDGDGIGDICDPTPRGEDPTGTGSRGSTTLPDVHGTRADGCPDPVTRGRPRRRPRRPTPTPRDPSPGASVVGRREGEPKKCPRGARRARSRPR